MDDMNGTGYGLNYDGTRGDVLNKLQEMLEHTPRSALATRPLTRHFLEAVVAELRRLRAIEAQHNRGK